jgi:hypothetical protein
MIYQKLNFPSSPQPKYAVKQCFHTITGKPSNPGSIPQLIENLFRHFNTAEGIISAEIEYESLLFSMPILF